MNSLMEEGFSALTMTAVDIADSFVPKSLLDDVTEDIQKVKITKLDPSKISSESVPDIKVHSPEQGKDKNGHKNNIATENVPNNTKSESHATLAPEGNSKIKDMLRRAVAKKKAVNVDSTVKIETENVKVPAGISDNPVEPLKKSSEKEVGGIATSDNSQIAFPSQNENIVVGSTNTNKLAKDVSKILIACQKLKWKDVESYVKKMQKDISEGKYTDPKPLAGVFDMEFGWTPLMHAVRENLISIAGSLIELGCDVNARNKEGMTSLHIVSVLGREDMFRFLMDQKADIEMVTEPKNQNVLHLACSKKRLNESSLVRTLLKYTGDNARLQTDKDGYIPLHIAVNAGCRDACEELLVKQGTEQLNCGGGPLKDSALHMAVRKSQYDIAWIFMDCGAYVNNTNGDLQTPLHIACEQGDERFVKWFYLYRAKANIIDKFGQSPMVLSVTKGYTKILETLVDKFKCSVFERTRDGSTLVHVASLHGHLDTAMLLHERGVPLQMPNRRGARSIHIAARHGHSELILKLLQKGEDVDAPTHDKYTALHIAVEYGKPQAVETLLGHGAQIHIKGGKVKETALHIAGRAEDGNNCMSTLLTSGADPHLTMENGETALHVAARHGKFEAVKLLLQDGADPSHKSNNGSTPLHLAAKNGHVEVIKELLHSIKKAKGDKAVTNYCNIVTNKGETALHFTAGLPRIYKPIVLAAATLPTLGKVAFPSLNKAKDITGLGKEIANMLLKNKATLDHQTQETKETAFHYCAKEGNNDILVAILKKMTSTQIQNAVNKQSNLGWSPLLTACKYGHIDIVKTLLAKGARVDVFDNDGSSALHIAAQAGNKDISAVLLKYNAFINAKSRMGLTPLHLAAQNGFKEICLFLIKEHGATVDIVTLKKETPLHLAAEAGRLDVCRLLMDLCADPEAENEKGQKPIHLAANNHSEVIELFLKMNSSLGSSSTKNGSSCAHLAANRGSISVIEELLKFDKEDVISARDGNTDATALQIAAEEGHAELVKTLLDAGASPTDENRTGYTAVHLAAKKGHTAVIDAMRHSADISFSSKKLGLTALHIAAFYGQNGTVRELLQYIPATIPSERPSSVKTSFIKSLGTEYGLTPLHMAAHSGEESVVRLLLNIPGVQVDAPTAAFGFNPLHLSASGGHEVVVGLLLSRSSELLESRDANGMTALHLASIHGHANMCQVLLGQGAEIDALDRDMWTPLHCAAKAGQLEVVQLLADSGASILAKTNQGHTPIWFACTEQHLPVLSYLLEKEHDTYVLMEDDDFVFHLTVCGKKNNNEPLVQFVLASPAPVEVAGKLSQKILVVSSKKKEREKELLVAAKQIEAMATELLILASRMETPGRILLAVDGVGISLLDTLVDTEQKEVVAHTVVQRYLQEVWHGSCQTWASWKLMCLFISFILVPPVWVILSLPLGHKYYKIPIVKFMSYLTSHIHLMIMLCLICVTPIYPVFPIRSDLFPFWFEWIFLVWILGLIVSEVLNPSDKGGLGWIKSTVLLFNLFGVAVHGIGFFIGKEYYGVLLYIRNQMFACAILFATVQILDFLAFHYLFGPWAIIIGNLMKDLARFLSVLVIFMLGFCLIMTSLNSPMEMLEAVPILTDLTNFTNLTLLDDLPSGVLILPIKIFDLLFFALFGKTERGDMRVEESLADWAGNLIKVIFGLYMLVTLIVLINLLIATMSDTYQRIQAQSDIEWKYGLAKLIINYSKTVATPSPINIFTFWIVWIFKKINKQRVKRLKSKPVVVVKSAKVSQINQFDKMTPKQKWKDLYRRISAENSTKATTFNMANVAALLKERRFSIEVQDVCDRIDTVTDWPLIANKYRDLIGINKPKPKE